MGIVRYPLLPPNSGLRVNKPAEWEDLGVSALLFSTESRGKKRLVGTEYSTRSLGTADGRSCTSPATSPGDGEARGQGQWENHLRAAPSASPQAGRARPRPQHLTSAPGPPPATGTHKKNGCERAPFPPPGQPTRGSPHRVPHQPLEAEALLLGGAAGDDERLRLLAGPGRPRGRGRRHFASRPRRAPPASGRHRARPRRGCGAAMAGAAGKMAAGLSPAPVPSAVPVVLSPLSVGLWERRGKGYGLPEPFLSLSVAVVSCWGGKTCYMRDPPPHTETPQGLLGTGRAVRRRQAAAPGPGAAFLGVFLSHCCVSQCSPLS